MKKNKILIVFILLAIGFTSSKISFSQDTIEDQIILKDYSSLILPPIDSLFMSLEKNPNIKVHDYRIMEQESNIKTKKRDWINYLRFSSSYQYGYQGAESLVQGQLIPAYYQTAQNAQNLYHIGALISIPIGDLIDNRNKINKEKHKLNQIKAEKDISLIELKYLVIEMYNKANEQLNNYKIKVESLNYSELRAKLSQQDFVNGAIKIDELTDAKHSQSVSMSELQKTKSELLIALMKLEVICNYKFAIIKYL